MADPRHAARYRKGVILGLTIAEVFALIVFLLLIMLAVHGELKRKAEEVAANLAQRHGTGAAARLLQAAERTPGGLEAATAALATLNAGGTLTPAGDRSSVVRQLDALSPRNWRSWPIRRRLTGPPGCLRWCGISTAERRRQKTR